jgi:hypothetical protein
MPRSRLSCVLASWWCFCTHILFQVSQQFVACILLPDNTKASVSDVSVLPEAKFVHVVAVYANVQ